MVFNDLDTKIHHLKQIVKTNYILH